MGWLSWTEIPKVIWRSCTCTNSGIVSHRTYSLRCQMCDLHSKFEEDRTKTAVVTVKDRYFGQIHRQTDIHSSDFYPNVTTLRSGLCCRNSVCLSSVCLYLCDSAATRPSSQITLGKLVVIIYLFIYLFRSKLYQYNDTCAWHNELEQQDWMTSTNNCSYV